MVKRQQLKFAHHGVSQSGEPLHGAVIPCKLGLLNSTSQTVKSSGLMLQAAIKGKPTEVDPTIQKHPIAKPKISGAGRRNSEQKGRCENVDKKEI